VFISQSRKLDKHALNLYTSLRARVNGAEAPNFWLSQLERVDIRDE
jgi:hypothetical protein